MQWLRLYHDTAHDPKWRMVAIECGQPVAVVLGVWSYMLIFASASPVRGVLVDWDDRVAGAALDLKGAVVAEIREAMQGLVLDGYELTGWDKRQRASDNVAARVARHRAKHPDSAPPGGGSGGGDGGQPGSVNGRHYRAETFHADDVTLHSENETEKPLRAQTQTSEEDKGGVLCETSESPPRVCAGAREGGTQAPPVSAKIITLDDARGPAVPLPAGWLLPDEWRAWAERTGQRNVDGAAQRFFDHWFELGAAKTADGWRRAWERWIGQNIERGFAHGRQRHNGKSNRGNGLTAYVYAEYGGGPGDAEDDPADGRGRLVRG